MSVGTLSLIGTLTLDATLESAELYSSGGAALFDVTLFALGCTDCGWTATCVLVSVDPRSVAVTDLGIALPDGLDALASPSF